MNSKRQALTIVGDILARISGVSPSVVLAALQDREAAGSTGVGDGVALPHARVAPATGLHAVFVRLDAPVPFEALDEQPVDLIFAMLVPADAPGAEHIQAQARVARLLRRPSLREQIRKAQSADAIHALLVGEAQPSAA